MTWRCWFTGHDLDLDRRSLTTRCRRCGRTSHGLQHTADIPDTTPRVIYARPDGREHLHRKPHLLKRRIG
jgi:tRNA(Ile2) C34 agmatinyltransferase TiaS